MEIVEKSYGKLLRFSLMIVNPFKKSIIKTQCKVHMFINNQALDILKTSGNLEAYNFLAHYIKDINNGVVWADQDFKSINHFYNPFKRKGLYGHKNALILAREYYGKAKMYWLTNKPRKAMFYLGAAVHLVQDMTIPQHANIRLMDSHKQYETYVKKSYQDYYSFSSYEEPICLDSIDNFIKFNARATLRAYKKFKKIKRDQNRFSKMLECGLPLAQRTTAGCFLKFYLDVIKDLPL